MDDQSSGTSLADEYPDCRRPPRNCTYRANHRSVLVSGGLSRRLWWPRELAEVPACPHTQDACHDGNLAVAAA